MGLIEMGIASKGMLLDVYRPATPPGEPRDYTNGGVSSRVARLVAVGVVENQWASPGTAAAEAAKPLPARLQVIAPGPRWPAVILVRRANGAAVDWLHLEPAEPHPADRTSWMAGGSFAGTLDSRWREFLDTLTPRHGLLVPVHDRSDAWNLYNALTV